MPVRVLGNNGAGDVATVAQGINWAADNGAKVISLSLGGSGQSITLLNAVRYAIGKGAVVVAAAGNDGVSTPMYPGAYTEVIAVGATNAAGGRASFSNYGSWVDVAGPGALIYSTTYNGGYGLMSGTSMATPAIAGVASLVWASLGAGATPQAVRARLEDTADRTNATWVAKGIVNAQQAVQPGASGGDFEFATTTAALTAGATIRLSLSAPTLRNGASFNLTASDNAAVRVPASVRLLRNQTRLSFTARTMDVASPTPVTLTLTREGISKTVSVTINPNTLDSLIARSEVRGGGTATIAAAFGQVLAGPGSATISLSAQPTGVITLPATIVLRPGQKSVARVISTKTVTSATEVKVTATHQGVSKSTTIRVLPRS
jgi:subtilisin family serine protease